MKADTLRFGSEPETEVRFDGSRDRRSVSGSIRTNLPESVEPGVEYGDVRVDYTLTTRLADDAGDRAAPPREGNGSEENGQPEEGGSEKNGAEEGGVERGGDEGGGRAGESGEGAGASPGARGERDT
ncbi:hypothetical protein E0L36_23375 [Streptomyces sp. AJS327]|uniref:hypothetical protein n=1 Tax=Streptomyces sp. AJS327 TaxID=2545265 RepID=UPI0015DDC1D8|nr:hypothetical protein [Streptomyces sp. AJS327]MBA0053698.1 hypothetical protein [Streptomyces sp. AJS327]